MYLWVFVTTPNRTVANKVSSYLIRKRLVACANMFPVSSMYRWNKKVYRHNEIALILKTSAKNKKKIFSEIKKMHPYKLPDLTAFKVESTKDVKKWILKSLK